MTAEPQSKTYPSVEAWREEGFRRFGPDQLQHKFVCPSCGYIATPQDWANLDGHTGVAFSCIGRWMPNPQEMFTKDGGPCNYAGGGLFKVNPVSIAGIDVNFFDYAPVETPATESVNHA